MIILSAPGQKSWFAELIVKHEKAESILASLASESPVEKNHDNSFSISLEEENARNLRAFWNTRMRSIEAAESILSSLNKDS